MTYHPGCPECDAAEAYWQAIRQHTDRQMLDAADDTMICLVISAAEVPFCWQHNPDEEDDDEGH